jgi:chromosomal replication initiation ATPase DnaA
MTNLNKESKKKTTKSSDFVGNSKLKEVVASRYKNKIKEAELDRAVKIFVDVCIYYEVTIVQVRAKYRGVTVVKVRQVSCYVIKEKTDLTFGDISNILGIDRSTASHNYSLIKDLINTKQGEELKKDINNILIVTI